MSVVPRQIRSFVRRESRMTASQQRALTTLWPRYGIAPDEARWTFADLFGRQAPVIVEIGFGNGVALLQGAQQRPDMDFIGIEVHRPGVGQLLNALEAHEIGNVRVCCQDALEVLMRNIQSGSLAGLHVFFPDPWPKKRHHKRRLVQAEFIALASAKLQSGGLLCLATDWADYAEQMRMLLPGAPQLRLLDPAHINSPYFISRPSTKFEARGIKLQHPIQDFILQKVPV